MLPPRRACSLLKTSLCAMPFLNFRPPGTGLPACSSATRCLPTAHGPAEDLRLGAAGRLGLGDDAVVDLLEDARRGAHQGRLDDAQVVDDLVDSTVHIGRYPDVDDAADQRLAERVRQRQPQELQVAGDAAPRSRPAPRPPSTSRGAAARRPWGARWCRRCRSGSPGRPGRCPRRSSRSGPAARRAPRCRAFSRSASVICGMTAAAVRPRRR